MEEQVAFWGPIAQAVSFVLVTPQFLGPTRIEKFEDLLDRLLTKVSSSTILTVLRFLITLAVVAPLVWLIGFESDEGLLSLRARLRDGVVAVVVVAVAAIVVAPEGTIRTIEGLLRKTRQRLASGTPLAVVVFMIGAAVFFATVALEAYVATLDTNGS